MSTPKLRKRDSIYSPHPSIAYAQSVVANMKGRTGRSLEEWIDFVKKRGPATEEGRRAWLKDRHGLGTNYASWIAARSAGRGEDDTDPDKYLEAAEQYVEDMFSGPKAGLRAIYGRLLESSFALGADVRVCPCKTMVPVYRNHAIAEIKAAARTRIDLGLALGKHTGKLPKRLVDTGGATKKDRITHKIELETPDDVDEDVVRWLREAYDLDAGGRVPRGRVAGHADAT